MKKRVLLGFMTLCLGFLLCLSAFTVASITDTSGHWAEVHIEKWINDGLITGYPGGQFKPDNSITRAELVSLVNRAFKIPKSNTSHNFSDVRPSDWFYDDVMSGQAAGYISGYPDGTFKPNNPITRQEAAALLTKFLNLATENESAIDSFSDYQSIGKWAELAVNGVVTHGIMSGFPDKTFRAQKNITRAETVVTLDKARAYQPEKISGINGLVKLNNQPVKGATVKVFPKGSHESLKELVTGEDGTFTFAVLDGQYEITAVLDKNVGYAGPITVTGGSAAGTQEVLLTTGARVTGKLVDKSGRALANIPFYFTTNPTFSRKTDDNGGFSIVLPARGPDGQLLSYTGFFFHNGTRQDFASNQQFNEDTNLGQLQTNVPGQSSAGGGAPADNTPPTWALTYPKTADITRTGLKLLAKADEGGTAYYVVLADGAAAPTAAEVKNGTGSAGSAAVQKGQQALQADTEAGITITGLNAGTPYDIYVVAEDGAGNLQATVNKLDVTTLVPPDTSSPTWVQGYPKTAVITQNGFDLLLKTDENGNAYYVVLANGAASPTAAEVKSGSGAIKHGQQALQANTEASISISGLNAGTDYDIYVVAEDAAANLQSDPVKLDVTTAAPDPEDTTPPSVSSASVNGSTLVLTFNETWTKPQYHQERISA